ncbi:rhodanese-like domain-containing protein [Planktotalea sp.]|uniref:rhodanese-like domain-containing protein n=1 Tax=Planktotalea sp. TaxID=2029877 RepID=UPI003D6A0AC7
MSYFSWGVFTPAKVMAIFSAVCMPHIASADIVPGQQSVDFEFGGQPYSIQQGQSGSTTLPSAYAKTARPCPSECIEPRVAAEGVVTLTEHEVFGFMQQRVSAGTGLLVDVRLPAEFEQGSIPAAISVPAPTLVASNPYREDLLLALGAKGSLGQMDFSGAFDLLIFDDGPWSPTAREATQLFLEAGYPAQKIFYYRGGLQMWHLFGLTVSK